LKYPECAIFQYKTDNGGCSLFKAGAAYKASSSFNIYERFEADTMASFKMVQHILVTTDTAKISCKASSNVLCDELEVDVSEAGLLT